MRTDLPAGTVTFLFTDVEGSTKLLHELGADAYAGALAEHRRVVRETCRAEAGVEVDTQGDAFFFAFRTAPGAAAAASTMSEGLAPGPIRIRVGLHTGAPLLTDEGYVGEDVHRAARIAAAGHGGQVLVSSATASLLDVKLLDLGEHRFKDLGAPERVYQLGDRPFPPLKSLYRTNLPTPSTPFLGREREVAEIVGRVQRADVHLLTLTGPGGTGKTRAALQVAAEASDSFPGGLWWVALAPLRDAHLLPAALREGLGVDEQPGQELADSVAERLTGSKALVLLDNAEHLLPGDRVSEIAWLRDVPGPTILVTSRERLQLQGEHVYAVPSLDADDGVELFLTRARALGTDVGATPEVVELCERLDYLPLALELAAARTVVFSPGQLLERISERLDLLRAGRDADPRQQTLRATIEWSYDLLDPEEQRVLRALSVFAGGCAFAAAEAVCAADADTIQSLVDKSLLRRRVSAVPRFLMLETIRELAGEKLASAGEDADLMRRHSEHYLEIALSANLAPDREGQMHHDLVIPERDNMRAALAWALDSGNWELGLELVVALENYWATNAAHEGREWAETLLASAPTDPSPARFRALRAQGGMENIIGQFELGEQHFGEALAMARTLGDELGIAILLHRLATSAASRGDIERVRVFAEESLDAFRRIGFPKGEAQALTSLAEVAQAEGDTERALELLGESRRLAESSGFRWWQAGALARLAALLLSLGRLDDARADTEQALALSVTMHDRSAIVYELGLLAEIHSRNGETERAGELWGAVEAEEARAPVGGWLHGPVRFRPSSTDPDAALDGGLAAGRALTLDEAVALALGEAPAT